MHPPRPAAPEALPPGDPEVGGPAPVRRPAFAGCPTGPEVVGIVGVCALTMVAGMAALAAASAHTGASFLSFAGRWDDRWFFDIASEGYSHHLPTGPFNIHPLLFAFFPGLPLVLRGVWEVIGGPEGVDALVVGSLGLLSSCVLLWVLVAGEWGPAVARRAVVCFAWFPGSFVFIYCYSEALAVPLGIGALLALRRRWYVTAGLLSALAGTVRVPSLALVASCAVVAVVEIRRTSGAGRWRPLAAPLIAVLGAVGYLVFLWAWTGTPLASSDAERIGWRDSVTGLAPFDIVRSVVDHPLHLEYWVMAVGIVVAAAAAVLVARAPLAIEYKVYVGAVLLTWLVTTNSATIVRYLTLAFPVFIALALVIRGRWAVTAVAGAGLIGMAVLVYIFTVGILITP